VAVLMAGEGDYVPLVQDVNRLGRLVYVVFFKSTGLSPELRLASGRFYHLDSTFIGRWEKKT